MSDLKEKCICFYVFTETLEKWMETVPKCNIVTQEPVFLLVARLFIYGSEESDKHHVPPPPKKKNKIIMAMFLFSESIIYQEFIIPDQTYNQQYYWEVLQCLR
jgi:hypothetical protein